MSRFKRIKKKSNKKSSVSIDEKIDALNKELKKTGMLSEVMTTSNIYPQTSEVPNEVFNDFEAVSQGGYGLGLSGADGNGAGGAIIGTLESPNFFAGMTGVALSPPHPITGLRTNASTVTDGTGSTHPLVPGSNSGGSYLRGGALWFFDPNYNFAGQQGRWLNFEWSIQHNSWAFWDTNFLGFFFLNPNLDQYVLNGVNIGTQVKNKIAGISFGTNGEIGPPKNILITQRGIGDIEYYGPITPGRLFGLSDQGYNYLDGRSRRRLGGRTIYRTAGGGVSPKGIGTGNTYSFTRGPRLRPVQPVADPTTTTQTQQSPPEESEPPNIPAPQSPPDKPFSTSNPTPPPDIPPLPAPKPQPGNYEGRPGRILDPTGLDQRAIELGYNDELYPVNPDRYYTTQLELGQSILSAEMDAEFYGALSRGESPNYNSASINKAKANLAKATEMLDNWNRWKKNTGYTWKGPVSDREYDKQKALEKELKDKELDKQIDQLEKDKAQNEADAEAAATEARNLIAQFGLDIALTLFGPGILKLAGNALGKLPAVAKFFKLSKAAQKAQIDDALRAAKTAKTGNLSSALRGAADDIIDNLDDIIMKTDSSQALKFKDAIIDAVDAGDEQALRRIVQQIKNSKFKNQVPTGGVDGKINIPKSTKSNLHQPFGNPKSGLDPGARYDLLMQSYKSKGKLLNEATKLGHFEPEELNVDIEKLRKGIMPEFPKKSPKIIDGYHQDSKLKPKELNKEPYLKIDEKDLIRNHRLKPNEAQEMMQTIDRINDHIKEHPEDLIHAQMRYPIDDPRLAELNWRMDQMLEAGEEYLDTNFKENKKLFKRATEHTLKNIKVTDPKYVQQHYDELRGTNKPKRTKLVGRLGKHLNKYESKSLFKHVNSKDFKKISERKLEKEKFLEKQEQERLNYINDIHAEMDEFRSDWRKDISESDFTNITKGNRIGQTFQHASGATITIDNTMSDPSDQPSQVTLDLGFGEKITVDAPSGNEYGIAGITSHLGASGGGVKELDKKVMQKQNVKTAGEINQQLDASEKASGAETAKVGEIEDPLKFSDQASYEPEYQLPGTKEYKDMQRVSFDEYFKTLSDNNYDKVLIGNPQTRWTKMDLWANQNKPAMNISRVQALKDLPDPATGKPYDFNTSYYNYSAKADTQLGEYVREKLKTVGGINFDHNNLGSSIKHSDLEFMVLTKGAPALDVYVQELNVFEKHMTEVNNILEKDLKETKKNLRIKRYKTSSEIQRITHEQAENLKYYQDKLNDIKNHKANISRIIPGIKNAFAGNFEPTLTKPYAEPQLDPSPKEMKSSGDDIKTIADLEKFAPEIMQQEINLDDVKSLEDLPQNKVLEIIAKLGRYQTGGLSLPFDLTIKYAMGDYTPVTTSPGAAFDNVTLRAIENAHIKYPGRNSVSSDNYVDLPSRFAQAAFQKFDYEVTKKGIIVDDTFNFDDPDEGGNTHIGFFAGLDHLLPDKIKAQTIATNLVKIGDKRAEMLGYDPRDDQFGIPIRYLIPYSKLSQKQKKLFYPERFRKENKRGSAFNKIKKMRNK